MERIYECNLSDGESRLFKTDSLRKYTELKTLIGKAIGLTYGNVIEELKTAMIEYIINHIYLLEELGCELREIPVAMNEEEEITPEVIEKSLKQLRVICQNHGCTTCPCISFCPNTSDDFDCPPANWELE